MDVIQGKSTKWEGLWWHPEFNGFSSATVNLATLKKFKGNVRILVRKNKFFNGGENSRPNYLFQIKDSHSPTFHDLEVEDDTEVTITQKIEQVKEKMCDEYCKYSCMNPPEGKDEDWLWNDEDSPCNNCPLNNL